MNAFLSNTIVDIARQLSNYIVNNPLCLDRRLGDSDQYIDRITNLFNNLEKDDSIYHTIPENYAQTILVNTVYQGFPIIERLTPSEKSSFMNMISVNIAAYYKDYEQAKALPEGPITPADPTPDTSKDTGSTTTTPSGE